MPYRKHDWIMTLQWCYLHILVLGTCGLILRSYSIASLSKPKIKTVVTTAREAAAVQTKCLQSNTRDKYCTACAKNKSKILSRHIWEGIVFACKHPMSWRVEWEGQLTGRVSQLSAIEANSRNYHVERQQLYDVDIVRVRSDRLPVSVPQKRHQKRKSMATGSTMIFIYD